MIYFNRVDSSAEEFLLIFFNPSNSAFIFFSSLPVNNLNVILTPDDGNVN
jgi:hypothetical protein